MSPFKANYGQDPRMGFKGRKKEKYVGAEKFVEKMKEIQEEAKAVIKKAQDNMRKYANRKRSDIDKYKVGDLVMLSTKDLVTNFIRSYLHQFFEDSHGLKASLKPLRRPFDRYQSRLEAINNGRDIKQINW